MNDKFISANALVKDLISKGFYPVFVRRAIETAPAVDVIPVVRCKDCIHYVLMDEEHTFEGKAPRYCCWHSRWCGENSYCDEGSRRGDIK